MQIVYQEPDPDRFIPFDRFPRRVVRRWLRGETPPGGVMRWYLNLVAGLQLAGVEFTTVSSKSLSTGRPVHVIGKPCAFDRIPPDLPVLYGPGVSAHPLDHDKNTAPWETNNVKGIVLSCDWFREMYRPYVPDQIPIFVWPAGINTDQWQRSDTRRETTRRIIVYDKVRWDRSYYTHQLIVPILSRIQDIGFEIDYLQYGFYCEDDYRTKLQTADAMVFLCEHETQGFAYLQALSMDVPIFAWDRGGFWQDPTLFPRQVQFKPVTSVPYFDHRCGERFRNLSEFDDRFADFISKVDDSFYQPRSYITENFDLAARALEYVSISKSVFE